MVLRRPRLDPDPTGAFRRDSPEVERETGDALMEAFGVTLVERQRRALVVKRDKFQTLAHDELVPRFALYDELEFFDRRDKRVLSARGLDAHPDVVRLFGYSGDGSPIVPSTLLRRDPAAVQIMGTIHRAGSTDEFVTIPDDNGLPVLMANLWRPSPILPAAAGSPSPREFLDHVAWLVPDADERAALCDHLAWWHQFPAAYAPRVLLLHGEGGSGKNLLLALFARVVGEHNVRDIALSQFTSDYNAFLRAPYLKNTEFTLGGKEGQALYEAVKDWTSEADKLTLINGKFAKQVWLRTQPRLMLASNAENAMSHVPDSDRRFLVIGCTSKVQSASYYDALVARFADPAFVARVSRWLLDRDVTGYHATSTPGMPTRGKLMVAALTPLALLAHDLVTDGALAGRRLFTSLELAGHLPREPSVYEWGAIRAGLARAGCVLVARRQGLPGRPRVYTGAGLQPNERVELLETPLENLDLMLTAEQNASEKNPRNI